MSSNPTFKMSLLASKSFSIYVLPTFLHWQLEPSRLQPYLSLNFILYFPKLSILTNVDNSLSLHIHSLYIHSMTSLYIHSLYIHSFIHCIFFSEFTHVFASPRISCPIFQVNLSFKIHLNCHLLLEDIANLADTYISFLPIMCSLYFSFYP